MSPSGTPARLSAWLAGSAGLTSLVSSGFGSWLALWVAAPGLVFLLVGLRRGSQQILTLGALGLCAAGFVAGVEGVPIALVLASVIGAVLAWDLATTASSVGTQLGAEADTTRLELVHAAGSLLVGVGAAIGAVILYRAVPVVPTPTVLLVLLVAVGILLWALRQSTVGT